MADLAGFVAGAFQGSAALGLAPTAQEFRQAPGVLSGLKLIDTVVATFGVERITAQIVKYGVNLALQGDRSTEQAAADMVALMRARVPVDSGELLNGIAWHKDGRMVVVEARAVKGGYDYALAVEAGHHAGGTHADADFFADTTGRGAAPTSGGGTDVPAQPFFYGSAREALAAWRAGLGDAAVTAREGAFA